MLVEHKLEEQTIHWTESCPKTLHMDQGNLQDQTGGWTDLEQFP